MACRKHSECIEKLLHVPYKLKTFWKLTKLDYINQLCVKKYRDFYFFGSEITYKKAVVFIKKLQSEQKEKKNTKSDVIVNTCVALPKAKIM